MEYHVTRTGALDGRHFRELLCRKETIVAEGKQANAILLQRRHPQVRLSEILAEWQPSSPSTTVMVSPGRPSCSRVTLTQP